MIIRKTLLAAAIAAPMTLTSNAAIAQTASEPGEWHYAAEIYGYLPTIAGSTSFPAGGSSIDVTTDKILDNLNATFMGAFAAHNGRWGAFTDVIYLDVGGSKSQTQDFSIGRVGIPASASADVSLDLKGTVWTLGGLYRVATDPKWTVDLIAGTRMLQLKQNISWTLSGNLGTLVPPGRSGNSNVSETNWDGIIGARGRYTFDDNRKWAMPFYMDVGTGDSVRTFQTAIGITYAYSWGEIGAGWRYLDYKFKSESKIQDINFSGPQIGVAWRW